VVPVAVPAAAVELGAPDAALLLLGFADVGAADDCCSSWRAILEA